MKPDKMEATQGFPRTKIIRPCIYTYKGVLKQIKINVNKGTNENYKIIVNVPIILIILLFITRP